MLELIALGLLSIVTSTVAGIFGLGGGMLLIAGLPFFLSPAAIVPVHGITQIFSNGSRAILSFRNVLWRHVPSFLLGSVMSVALLSLVLVELSFKSMPLMIAVYILASQWSAKFNAVMRQYESFWVAGIIQSGLGLFVGATGPLTTTLLFKLSQNKDQIVATNAMMMLISHVLKCVVFGLVGFAFLDFLNEILVLAFGAVLGSWLGTLLRKRVPNRLFSNGLKWLLTLLAIGMIINVIVR